MQSVGALPRQQAPRTDGVANASVNNGLMHPAGSSSRLRVLPAVLLWAAGGVASGIAQPDTAPWLDGARSGLQQLIRRSAQRLDGLSGSEYPESRYRRISGSVSSATEWTEFDGMSQRFRFRVDAPLPGFDERFNAFIGRVDRDDVVAGRQRNRGARPLSRSGALADQTLAGVSFLAARPNGGSFDAGVGVRVRFPLDPFVKTGWRYRRGAPDGYISTFRETAFWQNSEGLGLTTRFDLDRLWNERWLATWSTSGTASQKTSGLRGFTALQVLRTMPRNRSLALELSIEGETDAEVPLAQYGVKGGYRFAALREWLVFEVSAGVNWPREFRAQSRGPSWGAGFGVQMLLGETDFTPQPITF